MKMIKSLLLGSSALMAPPNETGQGGGSYSASNERPEVSTGGRPALTIDLGTPKEGRKATAEKREGLTIEVGGENPTGHIREDDSAETTNVEPGADDDAQLTEEERLAAEGGEDDGADDGEAEPLPEFDAEKPEVVEAYEQQFLNEDGKLNMETLSAEWWGNAKDGKPGELSAGTYKWLESIGIPTEAVKSYEAGEIAKTDNLQTQVFTKAGGAEQYQAALAWARDGAYDEAAAKRFNEAIHSGDVKRRDEAIEGLMLRYTKANPVRRRAGPRRSLAKGGAGGNSPKVTATNSFKDYAEYATYMRTEVTVNGKTDPGKLAEARKRYRNSPWSK